MATETRLFRMPWISAAGPFGPENRPKYIDTPGVISWGQTQDEGTTATVYVVADSAVLDAIQANADVARL